MTCASPFAAAATVTVSFTPGAAAAGFCPVDVSSQFAFAFQKPATGPTH